MPEYIKMTDAITTTWMILRGMGYAAEDNPDMVKTVAAVFDTAPAADVVERPRWIPVTERLPEDGSLVGKLIADSNGCIRIASQCTEITLSGGKSIYTDLIDLVSLLAKDTPTTEWTDCTHITHWMQLPEPPEAEP